jgi:hypothetical protein
MQTRPLTKNDFTMRLRELLRLPLTGGTVQQQQALRAVSPARTGKWS